MLTSESPLCSCPGQGGAPSLQDLSAVRSFKFPLGPWGHWRAGRASSLPKAQPCTLTVPAGQRGGWAELRASRVALGHCSTDLREKRGGEDSGPERGSSREGTGSTLPTQAHFTAAAASGAAATHCAVTLPHPASHNQPPSRFTDLQTGLREVV